MLEIAAELSCNHLGNEARAQAICVAAAKAGATLFKVQVWEPGTMCLNEHFTLSSGPWAGRRLVDLYEEAWTPWAWLPALFKLARELGMEPFGAAFDKASVDYLDSLGVKRHKVASFELVDLPLIRYMADRGKPLLLSTGMATARDVKEAASSAMSSGVDVTLLACTSAYPADPADARLGVWAEGARWGLSDHSPGIGVACAAAALGASYIEKHLTLRRSDGGPDAGFSLEPLEFAALVSECRRAEAAVQERKRPAKGENRQLRRSLYVARYTPAGTPLELNQNVRTARPALGMPCDTSLQGKTAARDLMAGEPLTAECLA